MYVNVYQNQVEQALKGLKRRLGKEGLFKELKRRRFYQKPSVKKTKDQRSQEKAESGQTQIKKHLELKIFIGINNFKTSEK